MRQFLRKLFARFGLISTPEDETQGLLSPKDGILLLLAESRGRFDESNADMARKLGRDPSNLKRDLDGLKDEFLIRSLAMGGYELTEKGWRRLEPLTFVSSLLFGALSGLLAAIFVIGFAYDFFRVPILHYGLESSAIASAILLLWLYRRERINRSMIVRRRKRSDKSQEQPVKLT